MKYFFEDENNCDRLTAAVSEWIDTPFHPHACLPKCGVDCVHLVASLYKATGVIQAFEFGPYAMDGAAHDPSSKVIDYVGKLGNFEAVWLDNGRHRLDIDQIEFGDLLCFRIKRIAFHVGIKLEADKFVQTFHRHPVSANFSLNDSTWWKRITAIYRPLYVQR